MAEKQGMTIEYLLEQFYSDLIMVKRDSEKTADTYKISAEEFLKWLVSERIKLRAVNVQNLMYYLLKRKTDGCSEITLAKDISFFSQNFLISPIPHSAKRIAFSGESPRHEEVF